MFDLTMSPSSMISAALCVLLVLLFLLVWFVVNRASVRANQQVHLLEEIADYQRRQTELLAKLVAQGKGSDPQDAIEEDSALSLKGFIPER